MRIRPSIIRSVLVAIVAVAILSSTVGVPQAAQAAPMVPANGVALSLEGKPLAAKGKLVYETTVVSLKAVAADLGLTYSVQNGTILVTRGDHQLTLNYRDGWALVNGHEVPCYLPCEPGDELLVPLRFVMENTGYQVKWIPGPTVGIDIRPIVENSIIIGTTRQRRVTSTLGIDMQYPWISGLDAAMQDKMNAFFANRTAPALEQAYQSERDSIAAAEYHWPTELCLNYTVTYNQQSLLSILFDDYIYMGGAHGSTLRTGYTVDIKTGTSYALKDLFAPGTDYVSLLSVEIDKQIRAQELPVLVPFTKIRDNQDFYIKDGNLVIYFQQYELMPYAAGFPEFSIPMASLSSVLAPDVAARTWAPAK